MKRIFSFIFIILICVPKNTVFAVADSAKAACLMNAVTGNIVFEKNANEHLPMASTTKIMTLITALELSEPNELVTVPREATLEEGSSAYLKAGAVITMENLMYGLMLNSGNDAAVAIACHISGSSEKFADEMNRLARQIGAKDTYFKNPNGLDEEGHYTTAADLARITRYALKNDEFCRIVSTQLHKAEYIKADNEPFELEYINHNRLLKEYEGCIGVKTGYTKADGRCLVSAAERGGAKYIAVTLNAKNDWQEHKELLDIGFDGCRMERIIKCGDTVKQVVCGKKRCNLVASKDFEIPVDGDAGNTCEVVINLPKKINFSLNKGEKVGELLIYNNESILDEVDVVAQNEFKADTDAVVEPSFKFTMLTLIRMFL